MRSSLADVDRKGDGGRSDRRPTYQMAPKSTTNRCVPSILLHLPHRSTSRLLDRHPTPCHSTPSPTTLLSVRRKHVFDNKVCGLNGSARFVPATPTARSLSELTTWAAKPATALMPFRAGSAAFLSSSSSDRATTMKTPATIPGNPGTPPPMKSARVEVPLPSQEGKKGAMQYALYVIPSLKKKQGRQEGTVTRTHANLRQ
jgi:hypothetical protein